MLDSPVLREFAAEIVRQTTHKNIVALLAARFDVPPEVNSRIEGIAAARVLKRLLLLAARCGTFEEFTEAIPETPRRGPRKR